jgi:hypothetical protein
VPISGFLLISLTECYGKIKISAASTYQNLKNKNYNIQVNQTDSHSDSVSVISVSAPSKIYFQAEFIESVEAHNQLTLTSTNESYYSIMPTIFPSTGAEQPALTQFATGDGGNIIWARAENKIFMFTFGLILNLSDPDNKPLDGVTYRLTLSKDLKELGVKSKCSTKLDLAEENTNVGVLNSLHLTKYSNCDDSFKGKCSIQVDLNGIDDETYFGTVTAEIPDPWTGFSRYAYYKTQEIDLSTSLRSLQWYLLAVLIVAILLTFILFLFCKKYQKTRRRLVCEMQDVGPIAAGGISTPYE